MIQVVKIIFWFSILLVVSSYFLYPLAIWILGKIKPFEIAKSSYSYIPFVSIIIPAYNEEKNIEKKIRNTLKLEYPPDKTEILIGSDGSTDKTSTIVSALADQKRIRFFDFKENRGKTAVQNDLVNEARGEILLFTDAASFLESGSLMNIIRNFADSRVGCVGGKMFFLNTGANLTTESQGLYWKYESKIRELESAIGSLIGVDGPLYAVRRINYIPLPHHIISDFITPLLVLDQGKQVILEPEAVVYEEPTTKSGQELKTRRRITLRGLIGLSEYPRLLNFSKHPLLSLQIFFHKLLRWFVGPLIMVNFMSSCVLAANGLYMPMPFLYLLFASLAAAGIIFEKYGKKSRILTIPYYFILVNLAATLGLFDFLMKKQAITWETVRD